MGPLYGSVDELYTDISADTLFPLAAVVVVVAAVAAEPPVDIIPFDE